MFDLVAFMRSTGGCVRGQRKHWKRSQLYMREAQVEDSHLTYSRALVGNILSCFQFGPISMAGRNLAPDQRQQRQRLCLLENFGECGHAPLQKQATGGPRMRRSFNLPNSSQAQVDISSPAPQTLHRDATTKVLRVSSAQRQPIPKPSKTTTSSSTSANNI